MLIRRGMRAPLRSRCPALPALCAPPRLPSASSSTSGPTPRALHASARLGAPKKDLYEVLGVPRSATKEEVKKSYYKLAKVHHPDTNKAPDAAGA